MIPARRLAALLVMAHAGPLAAQAPVVTPAGDPSVRNDTLYALAARPEDYPGEDALFILDDGIVRIEPDGRRIRTYRQIIQVLHEDALESVRERSFSWSPGRETFRLNWIRIVGPDGRVISEGAAQSQESDVPAEFGDPVYSDRRLLRVSLSGGAVGTMVDFSYTTEERAPEVAGDHYGWWGVSTGFSVKRSRYIVDAPVGLALRLKEQNLRFARRTDVAAGRRAHTWATGDLRKVTAQSFAADSNDIFQSVALAGPIGWDDVGRWYAGLARDRLALSPAAAAAAGRAVAAARTRRDTVLALHKWVTQDIRYVSIALGAGGYQPRSPEEVVTTGFGDCKDKATLFVAALRAWGIPAATVLLSSSGGIDRSLPSVHQFDHAIAAVDLPGGRAYADLTVALLPFGTLPMAEQGEFGLLVREDGRSEEVTFPRDPLEDNLDRTSLHGEIGTDGRFRGWLELAAAGPASWDLRNSMSTPYDSTDRATFAREVAAKVYPGARGDSLQLFDGKDLAAPVRIRLFLDGGRALRRSGTAWILPHPFGSMAGVGSLVDQLESEGERIFPIDVAGIHGLGRSLKEFVVELPPGWQPELPADVVLEGSFGLYRTTYRFAGRRLEIRRDVVGRRGTLPPDRIDDLEAWLAGVAADDASFLTIAPAP
ncbi:MAG TPA: DUF3857 and transglutaminase domain-containing protein [Gemmatimonadales bacterium]|nr:DUF3857 and transglutaminase domain-containing protein [Gemmatimonadales bacterium]